MILMLHPSHKYDEFLKMLDTNRKLFRVIAIRSFEKYDQDRPLLLICMNQIENAASKQIKTHDVKKEGN